MRFEPRKRPFLIGAHKPAVAHHIGGENGGQPAFDAFRGQRGAPQPHGPNGLSALAPILMVNAGTGISFRRSGPSRYSSRDATNVCSHRVKFWRKMGSTDLRKRTIRRGSGGHHSLVA